MEFFRFVSAADYIALISGKDVYKQFLWLYLVVGASIFLALYMLQGIALYTIAGREGYKNRWMAFVPFFNLYYIGVVSQKNRIFKGNTRRLSAALAAVDAVIVVLNILYYVAVYLIFKGGYATPNYVNNEFMANSSITYITGYTVNVPDNLIWAGWVFKYLDGYILRFVELAYLVLEVFIIIAFFRTYSSGRYVLFTIVCLIFPVRGVLMFAVRNNKGKSYADYVREQRERQYRAYQDYVRNNPPSQSGSYYGGSAPSGQDPFDNLGANGGSSQGTSQEASQGSSTDGRPKPPDDPFGDL